jgi:hypothetical protein
MKWEETRNYNPTRAQFKALVIKVNNHKKMKNKP